MKVAFLSVLLCLSFSYNIASEVAAKEFCNYLDRLSDHTLVKLMKSPHLKDLLAQHCTPFKKELEAFASTELKNKTHASS